MKNPKPIIKKNGEVRELTEEDFKLFRPAREVMPPELYNMLVSHAAERRARGQRGPQKAPKRKLISIRLDAAVVDHFKSFGRGWQGRINETLLAALPPQRQS